MNNKISVIGAGLAGCEAAFLLANEGFKVDLYEMKPQKYSPAHKSENFAELVCSNSFKAIRAAAAAGLLKEEMRIMGSLLLSCADKSAVPAGGALAVDRDVFSALVTSEIKSHKNINIIRGEVTNIPGGYVIIATGPLTSDAFADKIRAVTGEEHLSFYDAAAPIVSGDSIDLGRVFRAARYNKGTDDYLNCPFTKAEYEAFWHELVNAETAELKSFEQNIKVYEGCMPVEIMAKRGMDTLRFGPLKPVGLFDPASGKRPWAVVQLRQENKEATLYNLVGFQTNLKFGEQKRVFSLIPGLENAQFIRCGVMHRNTFINSPKVLNADLSLKNNSGIYFAGQITGTEGYMESAMCGIVAAKNLARRLRGEEAFTLPAETMSGSLLRHVTASESRDFQPMGASMGLLPKLDTIIKNKAERYEALALRSLEALRIAISR